MEMMMIVTMIVMMIMISFRILFEYLILDNLGVITEHIRGVR